MIIELGDFDHDQVRLFASIATQVAEWNGNKKGVCLVQLVTEDLESCRERCDVRPKDENNLGMHYPTGWGRHPDTGELVKTSAIWLTPAVRSRTERIRTLAHEFAHANSSTLHGFTWRRMYVMLLPIAWQIFDESDENRNLSYETWFVLKRYAKRYQHTSYDYNEETEKKREERDKHLLAYSRCWRQFSHLLKSE
jgi:hypothetical protein